MASTDTRLKHVESLLNGAPIADLSEGTVVVINDKTTVEKCSGRRKMAKKKESRSALPTIRVHLDTIITQKKHEG